MVRHQEGFSSIRDLVAIHKETIVANKISTHMIFMGIEFILAVLTLIPRAAASKPCLLGYKALCSFSPISTIILLALVGLHIYLHRKGQAKGTQDG